MDFSLQNIILLLLMIVMTVSCIWQLYTPRISNAGIICVIASLLFFIMNLYHNDIEALAMILFAGGILLVILELFIIGAVIGILGMICIVVSFLLIGDNMLMMALFVSICIIIALIEWVIIVKFFKKRISLFQQVVLHDSTNKEAGYTSHDDRSYLVGQMAVCLTDLRPSGIIVHDDKRIDAVSEGAFIKKDTSVKIIEVEGTRVVVKSI
ncbi:NfeD family protein [Macrococcus armenti]|uniref:NfeD family protein n=1 Tax=Macrococcus armenti TaxID=2875764 RepID=UPI001CCC05D1|nr:NfeD family protein [Macrococcus armenti]UBH07728.1 serine protease [Macrococcus armenti]UBH09963.1 serine protease [Macrococcus armenti]